METKNLNVVLKVPLFAAHSILITLSPSCAMIIMPEGKLWMYEFLQEFSLHSHFAFN